MNQATREGPHRVRRILLNISLTIGLATLLLTYLLIVQDLPDQVYTPSQQSFIAYNSEIRIRQSAPVWNVVSGTAGEKVAPAELSAWETSVRAVLKARYEEVEGVGATVYDLDFQGAYHVAYAGPDLQTTVELFFPFPANLETLHDVSLTVDGEEPLGARYTPDGIRWDTEMVMGEAHDIGVRYRAEGANQFAYALNHDRRSDVMDVQITIHGVTGSEVADSSLAPTDLRRPSTEGETERFSWTYENLVPSHDIEISLPKRLGFSQRVAALQDDFRALAGLAPLLVALFLAALKLLLSLARIQIRATTLLLTGFAMALFYPAVTLLSGLIPLPGAASLVMVGIVGLIVTFLGLTLGWRTWWRVSLLLSVFLGLFSLGMLTPWRGILLTGGGLILVAIFMQQYAKRMGEHAEGHDDIDEAAMPMSAEEADQKTMKTAGPTLGYDDGQVPDVPAGRFCPDCGQPLARTYAYCPACGFDARAFRRCEACGYEQLLNDRLSDAHCIRCGQTLTQSANEEDQK